MPTYTREDQIDIRVSLNGLPYGDSWDSVSGGEKDSNTVKIRVGGKEIDIGGPGTRGDLTVGIQMSDIVAAWMRTFDEQCGKASMKVAYSILDGGGGTIAGPFTFTGTLKTTTYPDMDKANSSPGGARFTAVMSCNEDLASSA